MAPRVITLSGKGFLLLDSHPVGCERTVRDLAATIPQVAARERASRPVALIIGSSAGYGLAMTVAGLVRHGITGLGISMEKAPGRRTGTAGWYRTAASGFRGIPGRPAPCRPHLVRRIAGGPDWPPAPQACGDGA